MLPLALLLLIALMPRAAAAGWPAVPACVLRDVALRDARPAGRGTAGLAADAAGAGAAARGALLAQAARAAGPPRSRGRAEARAGPMPWHPAGRAGRP